jgi:hypothetical protein
VIRSLLFENFSIGNIGRACGFAGEAADAFFCVAGCPGILRNSFFGFLSPESQAASRRIVFVTAELPGGADFEAESTMDATGEQIARRCPVLGTRIIDGL